MNKEIVIKQKILYDLSIKEIDNEAVTVFQKGWSGVSGGESYGKITIEKSSIHALTSAFQDLTKEKEEKK